MWIRQVVSVCLKLTGKIVKGSPIPPTSHALATRAPQSNVSQRGGVTNHLGEIGCCHWSSLVSPGHGAAGAGDFSHYLAYLSGVNVSPIFSKELLPCQRKCPRRHQRRPREFSQSEPLIPASIKPKCLRFCQTKFGRQSISTWTARSTSGIRCRIAGAWCSF